MIDPNHIQIRPVKKQEAEILLQIAKSTFITAYAAHNTKEDMDAYVAKNFTLSNIQAELEHTGTEFYFGEWEQKIIAYLKLNTGEAQTDQRLDQAMEVERIYVLQEFQGNNIGQVLLSFARAQAKSSHLRWLWLGVWENNPRAIKFYKRNGFIAFAEHLFHFGSELQTDVLMRTSIE